MLGMFQALLETERYKDKAKQSLPRNCLQFSWGDKVPKLSDMTKVHFEYNGDRKQV